MVTQWDPRIHPALSASTNRFPFPGVNWVLLDACYLRADGDVSGWREIFSSLGVRDLLIFRKEKRTFTASELVRWRSAFVTVRLKRVN